MPRASREPGTASIGAPSTRRELLSARDGAAPRPVRAARPRRVPRLRRRRSARWPCTARRRWWSPSVADKYGTPERHFEFKNICGQHWLLCDAWLASEPAQCGMPQCWRLNECQRGGRPSLLGINRGIGFEIANDRFMVWVLLGRASEFTRDARPYCTASGAMMGWASHS